MLSDQPATNKSLASRLFGLINPLRDPSFTVAVILTVIWASGQSPKPYIIPVVFILAWLAVKSAVWFVVNTIFSFGFLVRKAWWVVRHPRLAWRLVDALGTEEIIIGGLHPEMFMNDNGTMHPGQFAQMPMQPMYAPSPTYERFVYDQFQEQQASPEMFAELDHMRILLQNYEQLILDWITFTEEKWRAVSDSQLGWKPLRGRWNNWDDIFQDSYGARTNESMSRAAAMASEAMRQRFENARGRGSAASSVSCYLKDLDTLRQNFNMLALSTNDQTDYTGNGGFQPSTPPPSATRTGKTPIIKDPMRIVDSN